MKYKNRQRKILFVDACARKESRTRELALFLLQQMDGHVTHLSLYDEGVAPLDEPMLLQRERCAQEGDGASRAVQLSRQFADADEIVIASPHWDYSFPAILKAYIENISIVGITFAYDETGQILGMCRADHLYYVSTAGGCSEGDAFGYGYLRAVAQRYGIRESIRFSAENLDLQGADVEKIMSKAKDEITKTLKK